MNNIEILAPAGGMDSIYAAVRSGADAVYIGAKEFSARASAHNFSIDEMRECTAYCHQRGVKVYLALNTIIFDDEMPAALELAKNAARADVDAIIIQDMGLASLIRRSIPDLPLHASTQMTVHTPYGARALYELGFKRVVVSRELSLSEIEEIRDFCPEVELEVFVHGALCMCVSGQCYFSAMLGGRSANRGMCAQPCRLPMRYGDNDHALSLKDNGGLAYIQRLQEIGVASAKIEGRMKRPEYVAAAVRAAVTAREKGRCTPEQEDRLKAVFSRSGFTDGYFTGERGAKMFGYRRREDVVSADEKLLKEIRGSYKDEAPRVTIDMTLRASVGEIPTLTVSDGEHRVDVEGDRSVEQAINRPLTAERVAQNLCKTGGTPYRVENLSAAIGEDASLPASALNALRREALRQLDALRAVRHHYKIKDIEIDTFCADSAKIVENRVCVSQANYPTEMAELGRVYVALDAIGEDVPAPDAIEAPRVTFGNESKTFERLKELKEHGSHHLIAHTIAAVYMGKTLGYTVHAGFGMNLVNSWALQWARDYGITDAELSPEIDLNRIEKLHKAIPVGIIGYGHLPLMITRNEPAGSPAGAPVGVSADGSVGKFNSCKTDNYLQDRKDEYFPIIHRDGYTEIMNCVPILMPLEDYPLIDSVFLIYRFSVENSVEKMKKSMQKLSENHGFERITHGLYLRGVKKLTIL